MSIKKRFHSFIHYSKPQLFLLTQNPSAGACQDGSGDTDCRNGNVAVGEGTEECFQGDSPEDACNNGTSASSAGDDCHSGNGGSCWTGNSAS
ncbi:MAG: hypothetical protein HQ564_02280 [Candidatus Saganbacteria bacterium]|nr:hypothetical protein [Candidatus Saganbacteria bacterium]